MAKKLVTDELWEVIEPLLPEEPPKPKGGRPRIDDRAALTGILFVLKSGIPWKMLPQEMGCGSGMTCWQEYSGSTDCGTSSSWPEAPAISGQCCATSRRFPESSGRLPANSIPSTSNSCVGLAGRRLLQAAFPLGGSPVIAPPVPPLLEPRLPQPIRSDPGRHVPFFELLHELVVRFAIAR